MRSMSYLDVHRRFSMDVDAEMQATLERLAPQADAVRAAVTELVRNREFTHPLSVLPLIVHAVETGAPEPAVPLAVVHELWWISACHLDDLADGQGAHLGETSAELRRCSPRSSAGLHSLCSSSSRRPSRNRCAAPCRPRS